MALGVHSGGVSPSQRSVQMHLLVHAYDAPNSSFSLNRPIPLVLDIHFCGSIGNTLSYRITEILRLCLEAPGHPVDINTVKSVMIVMSFVL